MVPNDQIVWCVSDFDNFVTINICMTTYVASDDSEHVKALKILVIELLCMLQKNKSG